MDRSRYITEAAERAEATHEVASDLRWLARMDKSYARTGRRSYLIGLYQAEYDLATSLEKATGWNMDEERERIADEAYSEGYCVKTGSALNSNGDPIDEGNPGAAHPDDPSYLRKTGGDA